MKNNELYNALYVWAMPKFNKELMSVTKKEDDIEYKEIYDFSTVSVATSFISLVQNNKEFDRFSLIQDSASVYIFYIEKKDVLTKNKIETYAIDNITLKLAEAKLKLSTEPDSFQRTYLSGTVHALEIAIALLNNEKELKTAISLYPTPTQVS
jgi:hypothetical protein